MGQGQATLDAEAAALVGKSQQLVVPASARSEKRPS